MTEAERVAHITRAMAAKEWVEEQCAVRKEKALVMFRTDQMSPEAFRGTLNTLEGLVKDLNDQIDEAASLENTGRRDINA